MIRSNFTQTALLANTEIIIEYTTEEESKQFRFRMPTIRESTEFNFYTFLTFCILEENKLRDWFKSAQFDSRYALLKLIFAEPNDFCNLLCYFFKKYWLNWDGEADEFFSMPKEVFDLFCLYLAVAAGQKKFKEIEELEEDLSKLTPEERAWKEREKEYNDLIAKTKAKAAEQNKEKGKGMGTELVIAAIVHDFGLSLQEVLDMNYFTLYYYFGLTDKLASYNVDLIATATGSVKKGHKHKYWVNI